MTELVLTVTADDRPGIVAELADVVAEHGGNWTTSSLAHLADTFAGIVLISVPRERSGGLQQALEALAGQGLTISVRPARSEPESPDRRVVLHLVGQDRPGIVQQVSAALADAGVGIEEMQTETSEAPMAGGLLFEARAILSLPADTDTERVRAALESIADELMVDLDLSEDDSNEVDSGNPA